MFFVHVVLAAHAAWSAESDPWGPGTWRPQQWNYPTTEGTRKSNTAWGGPRTTPRSWETTQDIDQGKRFAWRCWYCQTRRDVDVAVVCRHCTKPRWWNNPDAWMIGDDFKIAPARPDMTEEMKVAHDHVMHFENAIKCFIPIVTADGHSSAQIGVFTQKKQQWA